MNCCTATGDEDTIEITKLGGPGQFLDLTIRDLLDAKKRGVPGAYTCFKLLNRDEYRK